MVGSVGDAAIGCGVAVAATAFMVGAEFIFAPKAVAIGADG